MAGRLLLPLLLSAPLLGPYAMAYAVVLVLIGARYGLIGERRRG